MNTTKNIIENGNTPTLNLFFLRMIQQQGIKRQAEKEIERFDRKTQN